MVKPSGMEPVLENPEGTKTKGQMGQVDAILKHFNNKACKALSQMKKLNKIKEDKKIPN